MTSAVDASRGYPSATVSTNTTSNMPPGSQASVIASSGLRLTLSISSTELPAGQNITVKVDLSNNRTTSNRLAQASAWPIEGLTTSDLCLNYYYPFGYGIIEGYYSLGNLSSSTPLYLFNPTIITFCAAGATISYYLFEPSSNFATTNTDARPLPMNDSFSTSGYWTCNSLIYNSGVFYHFGRGTYTVVAGDEWGNIVLLHFTVT